MYQNNYIEILIIVGAFLALGLILFYFQIRLKEKHSYVKKQASRINDDKRNIAIINHNDTLSKYSKLQYSFKNVVDKVSVEIAMHKDSAAAARLNVYINEYNKCINEVSDLFQRSADCVARREFKGSEYLLEQVKDVLNEIKNIENYISNMEIEKDLFEQKDDFLDDLIEENTSLAFFEGCNSLDEIEARYRSLAKAFHPDNKGGNEMLFNKMRTEYTQIKKDFYGQKTY